MVDDDETFYLLDRYTQLNQQAKVAQGSLFIQPVFTFEKVEINVEFREDLLKLTCSTANKITRNEHGRRNARERERSMRQGGAKSNSISSVPGDADDSTDDHHVKCPAPVACPLRSPLLASELYCSDFNIRHEDICSNSLRPLSGRPWRCVRTRSTPRRVLGSSIVAFAIKIFDPSQIYHRGIGGCRSR